MKLNLGIFLMTAVLLAAACSSEEEPGPPPKLGPIPVELRLTVKEDPSAEPRRADLACPATDRESEAACRELARMDPRTFDPVPSGTPCPELYGGPETARVVGRLEAREIISRFSRVNGCEIARWQDLTPVLEELDLYRVGSGVPR